MCILDTRSSEEQGTVFFIHHDMHDVGIPLNVNDEDIFPGMLEPPRERPGASTMSFTRALCEISVSSVRMFKECSSGADATSRQSVQRLSQRLQQDYVDHWDLNEPIYILSTTVMRAIVARLWLSIHHPISRPTSLSNGNRNSLLRTAVEIIQLMISVFQNETTWKWRWVVQPFTHCAAVAFVLAELCVRPICPFTEDAWNSVLTLLELLHAVKRRKGMMWQPMWRLVDRAAAHRSKLKKETQPATSSSCYADQSFCLPIPLPGGGLLAHQQQ